MNEVTVIYPHQLFKQSPAIKKGRTIILVEESLILSYNPIHTQKLIFHKLSLDAYQKQLEKEGHIIVRLTLKTYPHTKDVFQYLQKEGVQTMHIVDTTDYYLEKAIVQSNIKRVWYESPLFILSKEDATHRYLASKKSMAQFYKKIRQDKQILCNEDGTPVGGKWSFDQDNRKKIPKNLQLPEDIIVEQNFDLIQMQEWLDTVDTDKYGDVGCWIPYTYATAEDFLQDFLKDRFADFGSYEDAITTQDVRLFHSTLSPLLNVGLLEPQQVIDSAIRYADIHNTPLNSLEGFVRQIIGWREFVRAAYECDHVSMRGTNFWKHTRKLPQNFWTGETGIIPVDTAIKKALRYGYTHHIDRLMVLGNFMLLSQIHPDEVYRWFMALYVDAYDWVMVPNVYAMSQFADGGLFATKPYISGSNYIKKMSDYPRGEWEETWTALYWNFISTHYDFFSSNHRLSMMPRIFDKMDEQKKQKYLSIAKKYIH